MIPLVDRAQEPLLHPSTRSRPETAKNRKKEGKE